MEFLNAYMQPVVLGICLCAGYIIKQWIRDMDNRYIPAFCALLGIFLACWINSWSVTPDTILGGMISGLSSTGLHQLFIQYLTPKENEQKEDFL